MSSAPEYGLPVQVDESLAPGTAEIRNPDGSVEVEFVNIGDTCCGNCGPGLCYVDQMTGENSEGWGWQR